jgi:predicted nucleotidyltransferase component of viral defense system
MHRDDWNAVYKNQDRILEALKGLESDIFLAGGTGLHRFVLSKPYRHSEDLDFFFPTLVQKERANIIAQIMIKTISKIPKIRLEDKRWLKEEQAYRMWYSFEDNDEIIKVELLNFTYTRLHDITFIDKNIPFQSENLYNLLLYKLKALCDRPDTIKDIFDIYFILRDTPQISIKKVIEDLNSKFEPAIGIRYERKDIVRALRHNLKWDIEIGDIQHLYDLKNEINEFQILFKRAIESQESLDFSYRSRIIKRANSFDLDITSYMELIDILEENHFWVSEVKSLYFSKLNF